MALSATREALSWVVRERLARECRGALGRLDRQWIAERSPAEGIAAMTDAEWAVFTGKAAALPPLWWTRFMSGRD